MDLGGKAGAGRAAFGGADELVATGRERRGKGGVWRRFSKRVPEIFKIYDLVLREGFPVKICAKNCAAGVTGCHRRDRAVTGRRGSKRLEENRGTVDSYSTGATRPYLGRPSARSDG